MFKRILVVCVGNICRSPTAEFLLRERLRQSDVQVASAGLSAMVGHPMEATAAQVMREHGVDGGSHRARQLTAVMVRDSDLVLVMEKSHLAAIGRLAPPTSGKVFLLGKWQGDTVISDPFRHGREEFEHIYQLIEQGVASWLPHIRVT
ncbi:MAG: low molecular weight protein-tyrosine-phosphatase [Rhodanobacter sp.]